MISILVLFPVRIVNLQLRQIISSVYYSHSLMDITFRGR